MTTEELHDGLTKREVDFLSGLAQATGMSLARSLKNHGIPRDTAESICDGPFGLEISGLLIKAFKAGKAMVRTQ